MIVLITEQHKDPASFRDPSGFVFYQKNEVFRVINSSYLPIYNQLNKSGLYQELIDNEYLLPFDEINDTAPAYINAKIIKPQQIPFISYPYEWSFGQLKQAAILTLKIQHMALKYGMQLKDASAYNIQFIGTKPILIDTLSFEPWNNTTLWIAYKQFCQHFLAPLVACAYCDPRIKSLFLNYIDGIPLELAKSVIPIKAYLKPSRFIHIWLHELYQKKSSSPLNITKTKNSQLFNKASAAAFGLVESLESSIKDLKKRQERSIWHAYYKGDSYQEGAFKEKSAIIDGLLTNIKPSSLWDLGANNGYFTEIASKHSKYSIAMDLDLTCIENLYQRMKKQNCLNILPLQMDLANPSPSIGWENKERKSLIERGPCDAVLALAVIHHLLVSSAIPLDKLVNFFWSICHHLIIEYIPPNDPKFLQISMTNPNEFSYFTEEKFSSEFYKKFSIESRFKIEGSSRVIYHFKKKYTGVNY